MNVVSAFGLGRMELSEKLIFTKKLSKNSKQYT